ncbi:unnamed protein product [Amaranthus hypochondriacus]
MAMSNKDIMTNSKALSEPSNLGGGLNQGKGIVYEQSSSSKHDDQNLSDHGSKGEEEVIWEDDIGEEEANKLTLGLIGKIWTSRMVNLNAFMSMIKGVWALKHEQEIRNIGKNMY